MSSLNSGEASGPVVADNADNDNYSDGPAGGKATGGRCPSCGRPALAEFRPFCSGRCKDVDLARWLRGSYAIPGGNSDADEDGDDANLEIAKLERGGQGETD